MVALQSLCEVNLYPWLLTTGSN
ncbi:hypothetical protein EMIT040CA3_10071 [Bacillus pseudomycoides]